jgi:hypothetical protein
VAERFTVDPDQAQQVSEKLLSTGANMTNLARPGPQQGNIGSGVLEEALSEFTSKVSTAHQNLAQSVDKAATNFNSLSTGAVNLDQQEAGEI